MAKKHLDTPFVKMLRDLNGGRLPRGFWKNRGWAANAQYNPVMDQLTVQMEEGTTTSMPLTNWLDVLYSAYKPQRIIGIRIWGFNQIVLEPWRMYRDLSKVKREVRAKFAAEPFPPRPKSRKQRR